jgi:hypothetical protein
MYSPAPDFFQGPGNAMVNVYRPSEIWAGAPWKRFKGFREKYGTKPHKFLPLRGKNKNLK